MLHIRLLGEQAIVDNATGLVRMRSARAIELIAFLAFHVGFAQQRQRIAGVLWPDSNDAQALTNLRRELHHLRQVLADDSSLVVTATELRWHDSDDVTVDVRAFDRERRAALTCRAEADAAGFLAHADAALAHYRGEFLPGVDGDWVTGARTELDNQCVELCDLVCTARTRSGDLAGAVDAARRRVELRPFEEVGYRTLMGLQADMGDRAAAVSTYHRCASLLERELGVTPDRATRGALQRVLAQQSGR